MKKSYYMIAGLVAAIGLVELQLVVPSQARPVDEMSSAEFLATAKKAVPAARAVPPRTAVAAARSHATPRRAAATTATTAPGGASPATTALPFTAGLGEPLPIRLISADDAQAVAPGGFGDAGSLLAATSRASAFVRLPGDRPSPVTAAFGAPYGAFAVAYIAGVPVDTGIGSDVGNPIGTDPDAAPTTGDNVMAGDNAMAPAITGNAAPADQAGADGRYLDGLSGYAAGVQASPDYFATDAFAPSAMMSSVPDSQTWATLITGLALVGFTMRRRNGLRHVSS